MPADPCKTITSSGTSGSATQTGYAADIFLAHDSLVEASRLLKEAGYFLEDVSCVDLMEGYLLVYHFNHVYNPGRICLRVLIDHDRPEVPSISGIYGGANWHERECTDFFNITFSNHPNLLPLLLPAEFTGKPPLRKQPGARRDLHQLLPGRSHLPVRVEDQEFRCLLTPGPQASLESAS